MITNFTSMLMLGRSIKIEMGNDKIDSKKTHPYFPQFKLITYVMIPHTTAQKRFTNIRS